MLILIRQAYLWAKPLYLSQKQAGGVIDSFVASYKSVPVILTRSLST